ncbi:thiamine pyrophosphate-dependent enzyme [Solirubrobacter soli]|uniref:thiamine pyrophosphate-dependent enzyme n=1 Tax=Solirubrobacter soli TaxID=363832 RepID=UPI000425821B|nr:thiamine pyrophosphate-dependent enzyme [Solirubrobacter soli]
MTERLTTGQALVRWLQAQWSERDGERRRAVPAMWGIFGHGNVLGLGQALAQEGGELPLFQPKHEQSMVHAALGFAKAARGVQLQACTASIGPGATNLLTGAATATVNRLPVLLLPADTFASRRSGVVLQQLDGVGDITVNDAFRPLSRFFDRVSRPEQLLTALPAALRVLLDPAETGAVTVALHQDVLGEAYDWPGSFFAPRTWVVSRRPPAAEELGAARELLAGARRPLIIAGGGVRYSAAEAALAAFAEAAGIPVAETSAGKGVMARGPLNLGGIGVNGTAAARQVAEDADLVVCVGTRLTDFTTGSLSLFRHPSVRFLSINVRAADAVKLGATPVVADARLALEALRRGLTTGPGERPDVVSALASWRVDVGERAATFDRRAVYETINACARAGDWVVAAAGWAPGDLLKLYDVPDGGHAHLEFGYSCMGHEVPAGLGIRQHEGPAGEVVVVVGDGSALMVLGELLTAVQHRLKITVVVIDNAGFGSIEALALDLTGVSVGNRFVSDSGEPLPVDYAALATALGCRGTRADDTETLRELLTLARTGDDTTVIHCPVVPGETPPSGAFWDLGVPEIATDPSTQRRLTQELDRRRTLAQRPPA